MADPEFLPPCTALPLAGYDVIHDPDSRHALPVEQAIHVIGGKWKLLLLRSLLLNGPQRYNGLLATVTGISFKEVTRNLAELAGSGLIARDPGAGEAPYALTRCGQGLMPTFRTLLTWGQQRPQAK